MEKLIEVKNVAKSFSDKVVHRGVSFSLYKGETIGLLGNSGTGKSVLLRSLIGLEDIDNGEIYYRDQRIDHLEEEALYKIRTKVSYSFQSGALFDSISVFENVAYPIFEHTTMKEKDVDVRVMEILKLVNMTDSRDLMPSDLSGGMQKRVGLARSMALNPEVLLYDEPTAGLDPVNVELVLEIMKKFKDQGFSGIFVTHDIPAAKKICDRLLILKDGRVYFEGTVDDFENSQDPFIISFSGEIKE
jgi:phospholipid/cholesterol/gamma-HCH transport system ATP-binding protein